MFYYLLLFAAVFWVFCTVYCLYYVDMWYDERIGVEGRKWLIEIFVAFLILLFTWPFFYAVFLHGNHQAISNT